MTMSSVFNHASRERQLLHWMHELSGRLLDCDVCRSTLSVSGFSTSPVLSARSQVKQNHGDINHVLKLCGAPVTNKKLSVRLFQELSERLGTFDWHGLQGNAQGNARMRNHLVAKATEFEGKRL